MKLLSFVLVLLLAGSAAAQEKVKLRIGTHISIAPKR